MLLRHLAALALALDPQNEDARFQVFSLNCLTLNFSEALHYPPSPDHRFGDYLLLAEAFPDFNYDAHRRPSPNQLATFL